jgi:3-oxoadipate enol-lactonase
MLLNLDGRKIYFDLAGPQNAPTVCFTHSLAADGGMWTEQLVPLLAAGYRVLRLDMRGHGGSQPVEGDYTMDQLAGDVKGALDVLGIWKVHYIGLSIGGMIGQGFALAYPERLQSLTLCDTHPSSPDDSFDDHYWMVKDKEGGFPYELYDALAMAPTAGWASASPRPTAAPAWASPRRRS